MKDGFNDGGDYCCNCQRYGIVEVLETEYKYECVYCKSKLYTSEQMRGKLSNNK